VDRPPSGAGWIHEIKYDGYRMQLHALGGRPRWFTRNGHDWSSRFRAFDAELADLPDCVLDGELCALGEGGRPSFSALRSALGREQVEDLVLFVFDLLWLDGRDLRDQPLHRRKAALEDLMAGAAGPLRAVEAFPVDPMRMWRSACELGLEGIVSKRRDAPYRSGRGETWLKAKCRPSEDVVIGGWKTEHGTRFRSLLAGQVRDGRLVYIGRIHTGYSAETVMALEPRLKALKARTSPFDEGAPKKTSDIHWVRPELVAEVEITEWTAGGKLRQASFKGLREDKDPEEAVAEAPVPAASSKPAERSSPTGGGGRRSGGGGEPHGRRKNSAVTVAGVPLTHPDKLLWPEDGVTKRDLAEYYEAAAPWILPYIQGRPCSVVLATDGIHGEQFYQRHAGQRRGGLREAPHVTRVTSQETGKTYVQLDSVQALVEAAQSDGIELHPWNSAPGEPHLPGRYVFDLDPDEGLDFDRVVDAAQEIRDRLEERGLRPFVKTTGGKGLHVVAPFAQPKSRHLTWPEAKAFALKLCQEMAADSPSLYTVSISKETRRGRIFLDYLRNEFTRTATGLLSPRGRVGAPVSMPISWRECRHGLDPGVFTMRGAVARLERGKPRRD
jgi:bifunctional non-homologous end joining protein LigD